MELFEHSKFGFLQVFWEDARSGSSFLLRYFFHCGFTGVWAQCRLSLLQSFRIFLILMSCLHKYSYAWDIYSAVKVLPQRHSKLFHQPLCFKRKYFLNIQLNVCILGKVCIWAWFAPQTLGSVIVADWCSFSFTAQTQTIPPSPHWHRSSVINVHKSNAANY